MLTSKQKDKLTNRTMINISVGIGVFILWYVVYGLMNSSLVFVGELLCYVSAALSAVGAIFIMYFARKSEKVAKLKVCVPILFSVAGCALFIDISSFIRSNGLYFLSDYLWIFRSTQLRLYIVLAIIVLFEIFTIVYWLIRICAKPAKANVKTKANVK